MKAAHIAFVIHEANRAYCRVVGDPVAPEWYEFNGSDPDAGLSIVKAVEHTAAELRAGRVPSPEASHEAWCKARLSQGWVHGPTLDREAKVHPNLVPYAELPASQRLKDELFLGLIAIFTEDEDTP